MVGGEREREGGREKEERREGGRARGLETLKCIDLVDGWTVYTSAMFDGSLFQVNCNP